MNKQKLFFTTLFLIVLIASLPLASAYTLSYDANGNLISGDGKFRTYDGFNHLVEVRNGTDASGQMLEQYEWHPTEDRIVAKHVYDNGTWKETVIYASKTFVKVKNATGEFNYKYIYQNGQLVAQENMNTSEKLFFHNDNLGSVGLVTNESGAKIEETFYEPFGKVISGGAVSRFDYTGKEYDSVVGDYDLHARRYNPERITLDTPDNNIPEIYNPQSLNRYSYVKNNPYRYTDPTGNYGVDVHQDLTFCLARAAGFSATDAATIAKADQSVDTGATEPKWLYVSRQTEKLKTYHFENRADAEKRLIDAINSGKLEEIGRALHTYQDTYSHGGISPTWHMLSSASNYLYGAVSNPDEVSSNVAQSNQMAFATFSYLGRTNGLTQNQINNAWSFIQNSVNQFIGATSNTERQQSLGTIGSGSGSSSGTTGTSSGRSNGGYSTGYENIGGVTNIVIVMPLR